METENTKPENPFVYPHEDLCTKQFNGITLRDHFAGLAMQGLVSNPNIQRPDIGSEQYVIFAKVAYDYADGMLVARQNQ